MITSSRATDYTCIYDKVVQLQYTQTEQQVVLDKLSWYCTYYEHIDKVDNKIMDMFFLPQSICLVLNGSYMYMSIEVNLH